MPLHALPHSWHPDLGSDLKYRAVRRAFLTPDTLMVPPQPPSSSDLTSWSCARLWPNETCCACPQVKCCECGYESNTVDDFLHISLEITRAHSLTKALQRFTTGEYLDQENKYKCPKQVSSMLPCAEW